MNKPLDKLNYKDMFYYFIEQYELKTGKKYTYFKNRLGVEFMKIKRLGLSSLQFVKFIRWLRDKNKLSSINFLAGQLNDYYSSKEYKEQEEMKEQLLHYEIMEQRDNIVGKCTKCDKTGYINFKKCSCMIKFLKIRDKIRRRDI